MYINGHDTRHINQFEHQCYILIIIAFIPGDLLPTTKAGTTLLKSPPTRTTMYSPFCVSFQAIRFLLLKHGPRFLLWNRVHVSYYLNRVHVIYIFHFPPTRKTVWIVLSVSLLPDDMFPTTGTFTPLSLFSIFLQPPRLCSLLSVSLIPGDPFPTTGAGTTLSIFSSNPLDYVFYFICLDREREHVR